MSRKSDNPDKIGVRISFKVVDARIDARYRGLKLAFLRASNVELPVSIPASTPTNEFLNALANKENYWQKEKCVFLVPGHVQRPWKKLPNCLRSRRVSL